jgi:hypothetical protein
MDTDTANTEYVSITSRDALSDILRQGAQQMLATAVVGRQESRFIRGSKTGHWRWSIGFLDGSAGDLPWACLTMVFKLAQYAER